MQCDQKMRNPPPSHPVVMCYVYHVITTYSVHTVNVAVKGIPPPRQVLFTGASSARRPKIRDARRPNLHTYPDEEARDGTQLLSVP
jgi:hypothetical protein